MLFYKKTAVLSAILRHTGSHCTNSRNENDGGWDTFMENAEVLQVTLFTPGPSNIALFEGYMV